MNTNKVVVVKRTWKSWRRLFALPFGIACEKKISYRLNKDIKVRKTQMQS